MRDRKQLDELQAEALKYLVEVLDRGREEHGGATRTRSCRRSAATSSPGKVVKALAETFYDQSHYERGIEAYELLLKLDPTSRDAGKWVLQIARGYFTIEDYAHLKATYERALAGYTAGGAVVAHAGRPGQRRRDRRRRSRQQLREHALALHGKAQHDKTSRAEYDGAGVALRHLPLAVLRTTRTRSRSSTTMAEIDFYHLGK